MIRRAALLFAGCCLLAQAALAQDAAAEPKAAAVAEPEAAEAADPMVLLDTAKMTMAGGKLEDALKLLLELEPAGDEPLVDQEIMFQRLLLNASFLAATHFLLAELEGGEFSDSAYAGWLEEQRSEYMNGFVADAGRLLDASEQRMALDFVRFRLPLVTDDYLEDAGLYADAQVLSAASSNYADGRTGLGRGVVVAQARIALVLFAAEFYDLPQAAGSLELAAQRLRAGVPVEEAQFLFWLEDLATELAGNTAPLNELAERAAERAHDRGYKAPSRRLQRSEPPPPAAKPNEEDAAASD